MRRNYQALQFCPQNNREDLGRSAGHSIGKLKEIFTGFKLIPMRNLSAQNLPFIEQMLLPGDLMKLDDAYLALDEDRKESAAINLDEHLVFKARGSYEELETLVSKTRRMEESAKDEGFPYARDAQYGYLSYRPLLAGSGLYINLVLHLPLLHYLKQIRPLSQELKEQGLQLRPLFNRDNRNPARLFLLSNLRSLNLKDEQVVDMVRRGAELLLNREKTLAGKALKSSEHSTVLDQVWRSYGILKYARRLNANDLLTHWSSLRLGVTAGILPLSLETADSMLIYANDQVFQEEGALPNTYVSRRADAVRQLISGG